MSETTAATSRFHGVFTWGGVLVVVLGAVVMAFSSFAMGLLLVAAGMISWLFAKRRARLARGS